MLLPKWIRKPALTLATIASLGAFNAHANDFQGPIEYTPEIAEQIKTQIIPDFMVQTIFKDLKGDLSEYNIKDESKLQMPIVQDVARTINNGVNFAKITNMIYGNPIHAPNSAHRLDLQANKNKPEFYLFAKMALDMDQKGDGGIYF